MMICFWVLTSLILLCMTLATPLDLATFGVSEYKSLLSYSSLGRPSDCHHWAQGNWLFPTPFLDESLRKEKK